MSAPVIELTRGPLIDAIHRGDLALVSADGQLQASVGNPIEKIAYSRSSAKPFQAMPIVASGAAERWGFSPEDLALITGSHNGEPVHVERAASLLRRIGVSAEELACGVHPPLDPGAARMLERGGQPPTVLHNNCSGKHIGMIALAEHLGADRKGYEAAGHPVQREILRTLSAFTGLSPDQIRIGVDGCTVPCFGTSIYHLALAFARLMQPVPSVPEPLASAAKTIRDAMMAHPYLVAGRSRLDTELMQISGGLVSKGGAAGVECVGLSDGLTGRGLAVKIEDGAAATSPGRPAGVVVIEALRQLGVLSSRAMTALHAYAHPALENIAGEPVGEVRAVFSLERPPPPSTTSSGG
jgi:L-asparaginase II